MDLLASARNTMIQDRDVLRVMSCGAVDDGKSTLIGRLLFDSAALADDQLRDLRRDTLRFGTTGDEFDFALVLDGLQAEREQAITVDVGYRSFRTPGRQFILADTPGHEQYMRNMVTAASASQCAILIVDARKGILAHTRRCVDVAVLCGISHFALAINKIDLIGHSRDIIESISRDFKSTLVQCADANVAAIPVSARFGDNVVTRSARTPWYEGPTLLEFLNRVAPLSEDIDKPLRLPVQMVSRHADFRGFCGSIAAGQLRPGDRVVVARTGLAAHVDRIVTFDGDIPAARAGEAVTVTLSPEIDVGRGDILCGAGNVATHSDSFDAHLIWMDSEDLLPGRRYGLKLAHQAMTASITTLHHKRDVDTRSHLAAPTLGANEIGFCSLNVTTAISFDTYSDCRQTGAFILIDLGTHETVAAGMVESGRSNTTTLPPPVYAVDKAARAALKHQRSCVLWFTGLSGAGKSTVANLVEIALHAKGYHTYVLDGDLVRHGINADLGFSKADRVENVRRVAEIARLMADAGLIVLVSLISPFRAERQFARDLLGPNEFVEVYVNAPVEICRRRDPKGLYKKSAAGSIVDFTGVDQAYERPLEPEIELRSDEGAPDSLALQVMNYLEDHGYIAERQSPDILTDQ